MRWMPLGVQSAFKSRSGAIGGLIDLDMYKSEKAKLKVKLEDWWLRFNEVKWSNFGRKEAELAVAILDRWAGRRLWSWKRWKFAVLVAGATYVACAIALWAMIYTGVAFQRL